MKKSDIFFVCILLLLAVVFVAGCTSTSAAAPVITTPGSAGTAIPQTASATSVETTPVPTTVQTAPATPSSDEGIDVTINSAKTAGTWVGYLPPQGDTWLVLDVTLKNNGNTDFAYAKDSFSLVRYGGGSWHSASYLSTDFNDVSIPANAAVSGKIVFMVLQNADMFRFTVKDSSGTVISETDNIRPT
ncbi:DUF4352 domain-containing protein [Methanoregula sp.]|uniref:DUF4352 domain-containing protein n=1 Tax=Methanoregula sp. TaxID=2052170 RepID=UPI003C4ADF3E